MQVLPVFRKLSPFSMLLKRALDLILAFLSLPLVLPMIAIIGILIKWETPGPIFYIQERFGKNKSRFPCLKFRTMHQEHQGILVNYLKSHPESQQEFQIYQKLRGDDPRITRIGNILRKSSLDELPQIFNVFLGQMSLVGPRPYLPREEEKLGQAIHAILSMKPGITGLWQVSGRNNLSFQQRIDLDCQYVAQWSFLLDFKIMAKTFYVVITAEGAY